MEPAVRVRGGVAGDGVWEIYWQVMNNEIHGETGEVTPSLPRRSHPCYWIAFWVCIELEEDYERKDENIRAAGCGCVALSDFFFLLPLFENKTKQNSMPIAKWINLKFQ